MLRKRIQSRILCFVACRGDVFISTVFGPGTKTSPVAPRRRKLRLWCVKRTRRLEKRYVGKER